MAWAFAANIICCIIVCGCFNSQNQTKSQIHHLVFSSVVSDDKLILTHQGIQNDV